MKKKPFFSILGGVVVLTVAVYLLAGPYPSVVPAVLGFPFRQLAALIRMPSGHGKLSAGIAIAILSAVSAIPALFALRYKNERATVPERVVLFLLTPIVFAVLYRLAGRSSVFSGSPVFWGTREISFSFDSLFGIITVWTVLLLYVTLRLIRKIRSGEKELLLRCFRGLLLVCAVLLTLYATASVLHVTADFAQSENTSGSGLWMFIVRLLSYAPDLLNIAVIFLVLRYFDAQAAGEGLPQAGRRLSRVCCLSLIVTVAVTAFGNIVKYVLCYYLDTIPAEVTFSFDFPFYELAFVFAVLLYVHLAAENKELRDDNNLFI